MENPKFEIRNPDWLSASSDVRHQVDALDLQQADLDQGVGVAEGEGDEVAFGNARLDHRPAPEEAVAAGPARWLGAVAHLARQIDEGFPVVRLGKFGWLDSGYTT